MNILVVGDIIVPCELLYGAAQTLSPDAVITSVKWHHNSRQDFQHAAHNIELNGPKAEKIPDEVFEKIKDADILLTHFCPVTKELINAGTNLKLIGTCRGGMEHVDVSFATEKNIPVIHCIRNAHATSDFAIGLIFAETRNIARSHAALKQGKWLKDYVNSAYTTSMCDMTLGVVGLGHIGKLVAKKAAGIGMRVIAHDPYVTKEQVSSQNLPVELVGEEELFKTSDVVSLHMRLTEQTANCINARLIGMMKPTAYLINTSRAGVVDKQALLTALQNKTIGGAALDVFWQEPIDENDEFLKLDNITLTPHTAGNVVDALPKSPLLLAKEIKQFWQDGKSDMVVNLKNLKK